MLQSDMRFGWSRVLRSAGAVCGAFLLLELILTLLIAPPQVVVGDAEGPEAATDLQVDKQGPDTIMADDTITYTLLVTNTAAIPLSGVIITDTWTSQVYSGTYTSGGAVVVDSLVFVTQPVKYAQFILAPLPANSNGFIQITMVIPSRLRPLYSGGPTVLANSAVITTSTPGMTANTDSVNTLIIGPVMQLTKTVTPTSGLRPGQLLTYTFQVYNRFRSDSIIGTNVVITEKLPNNTLFQAALPVNIATFYPASNTVQWELPGTLPMSTSAFVTLTVRITPTAPYGNLTNPRVNCGVRADGAAFGIPCTQDVTVVVNDVFEKAAQTVSPPAQSGTISRTFPNRIMTYTVSVYNPFTDTVSGMLVTDTLPTYNNVPTQTFIYSGLLSAGPQGMPAVVSQTARIVAWQLPTLQTNRVYTFSFQAIVPPQMRIDDNQVQRRYQNSLSGGYAGLALATNDGGHDDSMKTDVVRQIELIKTVTPSAQNIGRPVTYTLVVSNTGPTTVRDIQLTDILPTSNDCAFRWGSLVSGQTPIYASGNRVSWSGITLTAYSATTLAVFRATVYGVVDKPPCLNTVQGYSPDTYIVKRTDLAPVTVLPPIGGGGGPVFTFNKTVNPTSVVLGDQIQYTVQMFNGNAASAHIFKFTDYLPTGFYYGGNPVYSETVDFWLQPNGGNFYQTNFPVDVLSTNQPCDKLPQPIYQLTGTVQMGIDAPPELADTYYNVARVAPVMVYPQANVGKTVSPPGALPGGVITFTITLTNNKSSPLTGIRVTDTLPNGFVFGSVLPGTPPEFAWISPNVFWNDLSITAHGKLTLAFTATAPSNVGDYQNEVTAGSPTDPLICIPKYKTSSFPVRRGVVEVSKQASPSSVNPLGQFQYNIGLRNAGPFTVTVSRFTETLPGVPGYPWKYVSMQSGDPLPISTNPLAWANLVIGPNQIRSLRVNIQASYQVGTYPNMPPQCSPALLAGYMTGTVPPGWVLTNTTSSACTTGIAPVNIIPGIGIDKDVYPTAITLPQQSTVIYTITVVNVSGSTINNIRITDTLPTGFVFDGWVSGDLPQLTNPPMWVIASLQNGTTKQLGFRARVAPLQPSGTYYNRLTMTANGMFIPPTGNIAPVIVSGVPSLALSKSVSPQVVPAGRSVTYTLALNNPDLGDPVTARVTDTLPSGFTFAEMISGPTPLATAPQVVWSLDVPAHSTEIISFRALVDAATPDGTYYNQLDGSSTQISFPGTGPTAPVAVVHPIYDIRVAKTDGAYIAPIGGETIYTIYYTNTLNSLNLTASNVVLTETFAPNAYLNADAPGWNLVSPGVYTYSVGDLPSGASGQINFGLQINAAIPAEYLAITNTVEIDDSGAVEIPEAIEQSTANNVSTDVDLIRGADLAVTGVSYSPAALAIGQPITVVVTVENRGVDVALGPDGQTWFGSDLYLKPLNASAPLGPGDRYLGACPTSTNYCPSTVRYDQIGYYQGGGLAPGQMTTLIYTIKPDSGGWQWLYIQADTFWGQNGDPDPTMFGSSAHGRILEASESNNIFGPIPIFVSSNLYLPLIRK